MGVVVAPVIGPTLGGWITDNYTWRWIFLINIPVGILSLVDDVHDGASIRRTSSTRWPDGLKLDYIGIGLLGSAWRPSRSCSTKGSRTTGSHRP